ncbi:MAG TPA: formate dehydrogenase subunit delta [Roseiarcus sp.]|nr:formate dehydrogenase subunit delta [Roseiarcus sp.]
MLRRHARERGDGKAGRNLKRYWTPKMIRELIVYSDAGQAGLSPTAARAVEALKQAARA